MRSRFVSLFVCLCCLVPAAGCKAKLAYDPNAAQDTFQIQSAPTVPLRVAIVDTDERPESYREKQGQKEIMVIDIYPAVLDIYADVLRDTFQEVNVISEHEKLRLKEQDLVVYVKRGCTR